nr:type II/IV secretion system protein [Bacteroidales bacterium]
MSAVKYIKVDMEACRLIDARQAWYYKVVPFSSNGEKVSMYISKDQDTQTVQNELEIIIGKAIELEKVDKLVLQNALKKYFPNQSKDSKQLSNKQDYLDTIIEDARIHESSDIHFETYEDKCRVRIRIDGHLVEKYLIPVKEYKTIINKIKIQANLDIAEKRLPQDGRIQYK